jgi:DNA/RNA-binding domain of Phe-tRNA-synthetase-like protein
MIISYSISSSVFSQFPGFCRGVVVAHNVHNEAPSPELTAELRSAEQELFDRMSLETILENPYILSWRSAYRAMGIKPSEFRPSVEALTRRVLRKDSLPSINKIVDIGNLLSIRHMVPAGAHALDHLSQDISLRLATGEEVFEAFGSDVVEHPLPEEIIYAEGNTVLTRRWIWRQAKHTLVVPETKSVEVNIDGLPPITHEEVENICQEAAALLQKYCGGETSYEILSLEHPEMKIQI